MRSYIFVKYYGDQIPEDEMGGAYSMHWEAEKGTKSFSRRTSMKEAAWKIKEWVGG
jgi:hypothetical protein